MNMRTSAVIAAAVAALAGGIALGTLVLPRDVELSTATLLQPARPVPSFELISERGDTVTRAELAGDWSLVFFGFTHCPDICPATLETLAAVKRTLEREEEPVPQVILASVDPERDDPGTLAAYLGYFDPAFRGLTGSEEAMQALATSLGIVSMRIPLEGGEGYTMDHSAAVLLIDPEVRLHAVFGAPHKVEPMARDIAAIMSGRAVPARGGEPG